MLNKKSYVSKGVIVLILSALIGVSFLIAGSAYGKQDIYFKAAVAKDIAFLLDSVYSVPGDVDFIYQADLIGYGIRIKDNFVTVFKHSNLDPTAGSYPFAGTGNDAEKIDIELIKIKKVRIEKKEGAVSVSGIVNE